MIGSYGDFVFALEGVDSPVPLGRVTQAATARWAHSQSWSSVAICGIGAAWTRTD